jgi:hypothetical protein
VVSALLITAIVLLVATRSWCLFCETFLAAAGQDVAGGETGYERYAATLGFLATAAGVLASLAAVALVQPSQNLTLVLDAWLLDMVLSRTVRVPAQQLACASSRCWGRRVVAFARWAHRFCGLFSKLTVDVPGDALWTLGSESVKLAQRSGVALRRARERVGAWLMAPAVELTRGHLVLLLGVVVAVAVTVS